jgi:hypothetical protein
MIDLSVVPGTITTGGTSQVIQAETLRSFVEVQNTSDTDMYLNFGASATTGHIKILPGLSWYNIPEHCPQASLNLLCATTGKTFCLIFR